jgi:hypothetical protein
MAVLPLLYILFLPYYVRPEDAYGEMVESQRSAMALSKEVDLSGSISTRPQETLEGCRDSWLHTIIIYSPLAL